MEEAGNRRRIRAQTVVHCPQCGKRTDLRIRSGDVIVFCDRCRVDIEVSIRVIEKQEGEPRERGQSP